MCKMWKTYLKLWIIILSFICICIIPHNVQASEETINSESIMKSQQEALNINSFIQEADKYTKDVYEDLDMGELFTSAITGNIDNGTIVLTDNQTDGIRYPWKKLAFRRRKKYYLHTNIISKV